MSCHEHELALMDIARGAQVGGLERTAALEHVQCCSRCAALLENERALSGGLRALAATVDMPAAASLEQRVLGGVRSDPLLDAEPWWRLALKIAAAVLLVAGGLLAAWRDFSGRPRPPALPPAQVEFVPWPGAAALPPFESGELVRTELPASVLPALGLQPAAASVEKVPADLLVGQDGFVRAVRLAN